VTSTDYVGSIIYENGNLKRILIDGGYYEAGNYYFYIRDHLGNNQIVANATASVVQSIQYYPFGMEFADATHQSIQPYKYNDKELDGRNGLNLYDYSARYMDFAMPGFTTVDPLAEKYYSISPYVYCANNPIKYTDKLGRDLTLTGAHSQKALKEIQAGVENSIAITYDPNNGYLSYTRNEGVKVSPQAQMVMDVIDHKVIQVNMIAESYIGGGAFM